MGRERGERGGGVDLGPPLDPPGGPGQLDLGGEEGEGLGGGEDAEGGGLLQGGGEQVQQEGLWA